MNTLLNRQSVGRKTESDNAFEQSEIKNEWLLVSPRIMLGFIGAVSCFAWLFLALGTSVFIPYASLSGLFIGTVHLCFVIGISASLSLVRLASDFLITHKFVHFCLAIIFTALGCIGFGLVEIAGTWGWLFGVFMGLGFGFVYVLYGEYICVFFNSSFKPYIYGIFSCAVLVCAGSLFVGSETSYWFAVIFPAVSLVVYGFLFIFFRLGELPFIDKKTSDSRHKVVWRSYLATATAGLAAGFAFGCIISTQDLQSWVYIPIEIAAFTVCLLIFIDALKNNRINETITMRWFLPASAVIVFPLIFVPESIRFVFALLLLCWSLFPISLSLSAICKHIVICKLSPIRVFSFGRLMTFAGIAIGLAIALFGFSQYSIDTFGSFVSIFAVIIFMVLVIFSASFVMTEDNYPDESRFRQGQNATAGAAGELVPSPGIPIRKISSGYELDDSDDKRQRPNTGPGAFYLKCEAVAKKFGLSTRQKEVLIMLAKGRNAEYITEKLVISSHTAKAHIYNIYQKTGVHSRQELMNLVEETEIPEG